MKIKATSQLHLIFLALFFILLLVPLINLDLQGERSVENRLLAEKPQFPGLSVEANVLRDFTRQWENWFNDRIGFREYMVSLFSRFHFYVTGTLPNTELAVGHNSEIFLITPTIKDNLEFTSLISPDATRISALADEMTTIYQLADNFGVPTAAVIIPQKIHLDASNLPYYIRNFIRSDLLQYPLTMQVKDKLPSNIANWIIYPYEEANRENSIAPLYPKFNFHWNDGRLTRLIAAQIAYHFSLIDYTPSEIGNFELRKEKSDLGNMIGFTPSDPSYLGYKEGFFKERGIMHTDFLQKYPKSTDPEWYVYHINLNIEGGGAKILWLGDSFSWYGISQDLAMYFSEALCIEVAGLNRSKGKSWEEIQVMLRQIITDYRPDYIVFARFSIVELPALVREIATNYD